MTRSWWGWGNEEAAVPRDQRLVLSHMLADRFGITPPAVREPARLVDLVLPPPRVQAPGSLEHLASMSTTSRASHSYGKAYRDVVRAFGGHVDHPPDVVVFPRSEADVVAVLDWCTDARIAVVPFGGGSSVVGGVECGGEGYEGVVCMDLGALDRVLEIDTVSRAARIQAGVLGPALEDQLRPAGLTLRHFPQSFEFSSLGGWIATRAGGHYATARTHIDDLVESVRAVTPSGNWESRRLPASGAGPSPDRMLLGSEGALGVVTEAWMRLQRRPTNRSSAVVHFRSWSSAVAAVRAVAQSGLEPANCRLLDPVEASLQAGAPPETSLLMLGFESADHPMTGSLSRALELCAEHRGLVPDGVRSTEPTGGAPARNGAAGAWRSAFLRMPYVRDALVSMSMVVETFETACTWDAFDALHAAVNSAVTAALGEVCGGGVLSCRFTHVYPDGCAPYFSVIAPGRAGSELEQWDDIKAVAAETLSKAGGTITHHHAVGRDHRQWYDQQRPAPFAAALAAAKSALDPSWVLNPGVLLPVP